MITAFSVTLGWILAMVFSNIGYTANIVCAPYIAYTGMGMGIWWIFMFWLKRLWEIGNHKHLLTDCATAIALQTIVNCTFFVTSNFLHGSIFLHQWYKVRFSCLRHHWVSVVCRWCCHSHSTCGRRCSSKSAAGSRRWARPWCNWVGKNIEVWKVWKIYFHSKSNMEVMVMMMKRWNVVTMLRQQGWAGIPSPYMESKPLILKLWDLLFVVPFPFTTFGNTLYIPHSPLRSGRWNLSKTMQWAASECKT